MRERGRRCLCRGCRASALDVSWRQRHPACSVPAQACRETAHHSHHIVSSAAYSQVLTSVTCTFVTTSTDITPCNRFLTMRTFYHNPGYRLGHHVTSYGTGGISRSPANPCLHRMLYHVSTTSVSDPADTHTASLRGTDADQLGHGHRQRQGGILVNTTACVGELCEDSSPSACSQSRARSGS